MITLSKAHDDEEFVELMRVKNGAIQKIVDRTDYNIFQENIARRTFDESGNYTVRPYGIEIKETLDDGSNNGVYASNQVTDAGATAAETSLTVQVSPGKAYVRGYEIEQVVPSFTERISSRGLSRALVMRQIVAKVGLLKSRSICERIDFETPDLIANCSKVRLC